MHAPVHYNVEHFGAMQSPPTFMTKNQILYIASGNAHKIEEISAMLQPLGFTVRSTRDFSDYISPEETGITLAANAKIKADALQAFLAKKFPTESFAVLADDSGLICDDLDGLPGVISARFAGPNATDAENNAKLIAMLTGELTHLSRSARFVCSMHLILPTGETHAISGVCEGRIVLTPSGTHGFGYDPYFYLEDFDKTMAELTMEEKNRISHRAKALKKLLEILGT